MIGHIRYERGIGIIEVLVALIVLMFAALSITNLQTRFLVSMDISKSHFAINEYSREMLEVLRANVTDARNGTYNLDYADTLTVADPDASPVAYTIAQWKQSVSEELRDGAGKIDCSVDKCTVSLRWTEYVDGSAALQYFNLAGPI